MENELEKVTNDLNEAIKSKDAADQAKICAEYEYDQLKKRMESRERELVDLIEEFRNNDDNVKILERVQVLENKIKELENENLLLKSIVADENQKCESLAKTNCQLVNKLEQETSKSQKYLTETKNTFGVIEENNNKLGNEKAILEQLAEESLVLPNQLEYNKNPLQIKIASCQKLIAEDLRYGREDVAIETLENRTMDLENELMKISNQLNKDFATKALQTDSVYEEYSSVNAKYSELQMNHTKLQLEYDDISMGIIDWIQENEVIKKRLTEQEAKYAELNEKYNNDEILKLNQYLQENQNNYSTLKLKHDKLFEEKRNLEEQLSEKIAENELQHKIEAKYDQISSGKNSFELKFAEFLHNAETMTDSIETSVINISEEKADKKTRKQSLNELSVLQMKHNELVQQNELALEKYNEMFENNKKLLQNLEILTAEHETTRNLLIQTSGKCAAIEKHRDFIKFKYTSIIQEYRQLFSSVSNYEIKIDNLEKEIKTLKDALADFELIQYKYEHLRTEIVGTDNSPRGDETLNCELNSKKLVDEICVLNDKFEAVVSERNLVETNYELLLSDYKGAKNMLEVKIVALDSFQQKYEGILVERAKQQKIIDDLQERCDTYEVQLSEKQEEAHQIEILFQNLEQKNNCLQTDRDGFKDDISTLKDALCCLNQKYSNLSDNLNESEKLLFDSREREKSLEQNIASLNENINVLQSKYEEFEQVIGTLKDHTDESSEFQKKYSALLIEKQIAEKQARDISIEAENNKRNIESKLIEIHESKAAAEAVLRSEILLMEQKCEKDSINLQDMQVAYKELQQIKKQVEDNRNDLLDRLTETQENKAAMETLLRSEIADIEQRREHDLQISNLKLEEFKCNLQEMEETKLLDLESVRHLFELRYNELEQTKTQLIEELKYEISALQNEYQALQKSDEYLKFELKAVQAEKINLQKMLTELEESKSCAEENLKSQLDLVRNELGILQSTVINLRNGKSSIELELELQLGSLTQKYLEMEIDLKSQLNATQNRFEISQYTEKQLSNVQEKYHTLQGSYEELVTIKSMMDKNINSVQQNSNRMQITIETLEEKKVGVEQKLAELQSVHDALKNQYTLLLGEANGLEKIVAKLEGENTTLKLAKQELETSLKVQAAQIYVINTRLTESETKQIKLKSDHDGFEKKSKFLQIELDILKFQLKSLADYSAELKDKSKRIEILENKKKELLAQLHELQNMHLFKTGQFENEMKTLITKLEESNIKVMQAQKNSNILKNKLLNENIDLKKKNQSLFFELDEIKRKQNDRKSKQSMAYDNNRKSLRAVEAIDTITDKIDLSCKCDVMNEQIKELTQENYLKEVDMQSQVTQVNVKLRKVRDINTNHTSSQTPIRPSYNTIGTNTDAIKLLPKQKDSLAISKPKPVNHNQTTNRLIQTEFNEIHESRNELHATIKQLEAEVNHLRMRYEESKCLAVSRRRKIDILKERLSKGVK